MWIWMKDRTRNSAKQYLYSRMLREESSVKPTRTRVHQSHVDLDCTHPRYFSS